ncbi:MAG: hypothetical protein ACOVP4_06370 [Bacteriovoracaceae bacterium]
MTLTETDIENFKTWLDLDLNTIAWEGRYADSFHAFWKAMFRQGAELKEISDRFALARKIAKSGPLSSWMDWLYHKLICYTFITKEISIRELAFDIGKSEGDVSTILREFLTKTYPLHEDMINDRFQVSILRRENIFLKFVDIIPELGGKALERGTFDDEILANIEVTLYPDWPPLVKELKKDIPQLTLDLNHITKKLSFKKKVRFFQEVLVLLLVLSVVVYGIKNVNKWYENYLINKITLYESNFFWLDKSLNYRDEALLAQTQIDLSNKELEDLEKIEAVQTFSEKVDSRFDPESDVVVLSSVEDIPKSFGDAEKEQSQYEEQQKGGYRDNAYARTNRKAYRILMASVDPKDMTNKILPLMKEFGASQLDNVKPGQEIPGGIYFNLIVPSKNLKDFMTKVSELNESTIFESRAYNNDPVGKNRVFIWVKSI